MHVSSANCKMSSLFFIFSGKSLIYIKKIKGPRTVPWGTPWFIVTQFEYSMPFFTHCFLLDKNDSSIAIESVLNPYLVIVSRKILWDIELKALAKSKNILTTVSFSSNKLFTDSVYDITVSFEDFLFRNPNWFLLIISYFSTCSSICWSKSLSKIFARVGVTEIGL